MTTWNCAVVRATARDMDSTPVECGTARAVGVLDCPECGTERSPFRENGEGDVFEFTDVTGLDKPFGTEFVPTPIARLDVHDGAVSGTNEVPERTE